MCMQSPSFILNLKSLCVCFERLTCLMAVRKAVGLKRPGSHMDKGSLSSRLQRCSCPHRPIRSRNHVLRLLREGQADFSQLHRWKGLRPGTSWIEMA
jgi:hypothetical protein